MRLVFPSRRSLVSAFLCCACGALAPRSAPAASSNAEFCVLQTGPNILRNAGLEQGQGQLVISNWVPAGSYARAATNEYGFTGSAMAEGEYGLKGWGNDLDCCQTGAVNGASVYDIAGSFYHSSSADVISNSAASTRMLMRVVWLASNGTTIGACTSAAHHGLWPADVWTAITCAAQAPASAAKAVFHVETDQDVGGGSVFGDAFYLGTPAHPLLGWHGTVLIPCEDLAYWAVEHDAGATGSLALADGVAGQGVRLDWDLGTGGWVQVRYTFPAALDLSEADFFGLSLLGGGLAETANVVTIMFADTNNVFFGYNPAEGVNRVSRWMANIPYPKKQLTYFWGPLASIDWTCIDRFFAVVKKPASGGGGAGTLVLDHLQCDRAADWPRQTAYEAVAGNPAAASNAVRYILGQQQATGLFVSWKEESPPLAWLYDQALALIVLSREGGWDNLAATNAAAEAADKVAAFLLPRQKSDGRWGRVWNPLTGEQLGEDEWVGDQAWFILALSIYAQKKADAQAMDAAQKGAAWLASQVDGEGKVCASLEGNVDTWWALMATLRTNDADKIKGFMLDTNCVWDADLGYWWGGKGDPRLYTDCATWVSAFARHPAVNMPERGLAALSFMKRALRTTGGDQAVCGLGTRGPLGVHNEVSAQYVSAGGEDADVLLSQLLAQQRPDGGLPGSPDDWLCEEFGWTTRWTGLAPTAWLYFALTGLPYPYGFDAACSGKISYRGAQGGTIRVLATNATESFVTSLSQTGLHGIVRLQLGSSYWVRAYRDANASGTADAWEACGIYADNPLVATSIVGGVDIEFVDPDTDADDLGDYWEYAYFPDLASASPTNDDDGDRVDNASEFIADTVPTNGASAFTNVTGQAVVPAGIAVYAGPPTTNTRIYDAYWSTTLVGAVTWQAQGLNVRGADDGARVELVLTNDAGGAFFRVGVFPP